MRIKTIHIFNYRKLLDTKINMEENITVIAGANNSGKTSLVELFNAVFGSAKGKLCADDLPAIECQKWSSEFYSKASTSFLSEKTKEEIIFDICELIFPLDSADTAVIMPPLELRIQIDYDDEDDIRNFADYIMELDPTNKSFYFIYRYAIDIDAFRGNIDAEFEKLHERFKKLENDAEKDKNIIRIIKDMFVHIYSVSCKETAYFSDRAYTNTVQMDITTFKALFNYSNIMAGRTLDDESSDRTRVLSKNMVDIASQEEGWKELLRSLPDKIIQPIQEAHIQEAVRKASVASLSETIKEISKTNGGQAGNIVIDLDVTEESVQTFLKNVTNAKYEADEYYLRESSQGLGYSNLIYIHLQLEKFIKTIDPLIVNFFVIEEPESHMHPQMQNVFALYLFDFYKQKTNIQGMLTTHSHEVVRNSSISQLRVLRQESAFICRIFDLREFQTSISSNKDLLDFYDWFYAINFPDIIFADKIILYEGDTERMLIRNILQTEEFESLKNQYISYVQVGGAYAYNYRAIIDFLHIKAAIITDLDYEKDVSNNTDLLLSGTTNATINQFAESILHKSSPTVQELYDWQNTSETIVSNSIYLAFQGQKDNYSRTLEEAMLSKFCGLSALEKKPRGEWNALREANDLRYTIPRSGESCCIHDIIQHTANGKTDFMYSVILKGLASAMLPDYIRRALLWLAN